MSFANLFLIGLFIITAAVPVILIKPRWGSYASTVLAEKIHLAAAIVCGLLVVTLAYYFVVHAYQFAYVYENSSNDLPLLYRISALWAGKEGSFLLWLLLLYCCGLISGYRSDSESRRVVLAVIAFTELFIVAILLKESPFSYLWEKFPGQIQPGQVPADGAGLNTLLIDPWMIVHPPQLFLGYASATIPFAHAVSALWRRDYRSWVTVAYPWVIFSMASLGLGIFLGGYWAYAVLGWGGYWGWDPVENSSLIPWLVSIALLHALLLRKRTDMLTRTSLGLSLMYFILVIYSAFLTRSGVLSNFSVHSFGESQITWYLLTFQLIFTGASLGLFISRIRDMPYEPKGTIVIDTRFMLIAGMLSLLLFSAFILAGTSLPILSGVTGKQTAVMSRFYVIVSSIMGAFIIPFMIAATASMVPRASLKKLVLAALAIGVVGAVALNAGHTSDPAAWLFTVLGLAGVVFIIRDLYMVKSSAPLAARCAHLGVCFMVLGIITSTYHSPSNRAILEKDKITDVGPVALVFKGITNEHQSTLMFDLVDGNQRTAFTTDYYLEPKMNSLYREPRILLGLLGDTYIAPEEYRNGLESISAIFLKKGEEKNVGSLTVKFLQFATQHMTSGQPSIYADLLVQGYPLKPGLRFVDGNRIPVPVSIPGSDRQISLMQINADDHSIALKITPGSNTVVPLDQVSVTVSVKRLILLVWVGTLLITVGTYGALRLRGRSRNA